MKNTYIRLAFIFVIIGSTHLLTAQQDAMFTKYMFNQLSYNPAYAGSYNFMSINAIYRNQWWGMEGAPTSQTVTLHAPVANNKIGLGMSLVNDRVGLSTATTTVNGIYAYHIPLTSNGGKISIGLQLGAMNYRFDADELNWQTASDEAATNENQWLPNMGAGIYYYSKHFYIGASVPHIINNDLRQDPETQTWSRQYRHYYLLAGGMIPLNHYMDFKPSILIKNVGLFGEFSDINAANYVVSPTEFDLDVSLLLYDVLWIGTSFRSSFEVFTGKSSVDSGDIWAAYYFKNGLRMGLAYDYTLTPLQRSAQGSMEVMLGYDFDYSVKRMVSPRYF